jgi:hypothetical protein
MITAAKGDIDEQFPGHTVPSIQLMAGSYHNHLMPDLFPFHCTFVVPLAVYLHQ